MRLCGLLISCLSLCYGYKFLVYSPIYGYSHTNFMGAIADTLTEAGHNVTMLMPVMDFEQENKTGVKLTKHVIKVPTDPRVVVMMKYKADILSKMWTMEPSIFGMLNMVRNMTKSFVYQCERVITDEQLLKQLRDEKFDVGISEAIGICGFGVFELAQIPASIAALSIVHKESVAAMIGESVNPSYVPGPFSLSGDRMGFVDRLKNILGVVAGETFFKGVFNGEEEIFRRTYGPQFKGHKQLIAEASYLMTNSNPYLDYPRPMLHKTVPIGGIAVSIDSKKNKLSKEWDAILNERNSTVLVSFGSLAKAIYMPEQYINSLLTVFERMPETTFIMKYEEEGAKIADHLPNVHLSTWFPQNALLSDPRLNAFVTHGGLGSTTELAHQGKPAILIPLFGDQSRNAGMLAKHGGSIVLTKYDLENPEKLEKSLRTLLSDPSYAQNAKRLSSMLINQPISAKQLLVRHSEFAAEFGRVPNLDPYSRQLSFIQYYLIDIILVTSADMLDTFIFLLHVLPNIIGLLLNALLFVIARYRSPSNIEQYSLLILNFAVCDFFACLTSLFVCQRIIPNGTSLFYLSEGPCRYFGARTCYVSYSVMLHLYAHTLYSTLLSFSFRYYILNYQTPSRNTLKLLILLIYVPSFVQMVLFSFADDPAEIIQPLLQEAYHQYNLTGCTITGNLNVFEWKALSTILHMTVPITPVYDEAPAPSVTQGEKSVVQTESRNGRAQASGSNVSLSVD
ncbi:unnamed protein product [Cylicocyclus nassatus]|uniref:glucuronosyltransferase n=1 Tax=Cylicocyclus nassatus TaxID=53992 RepID=A0AA36H5J3_CYLNA|nr:unnamed protein product [Cylicocyclus nassatus]